MNEVDAYLDSIKQSQKAELDKIRNLINQLIPEVEETLRYGMPTYNYKGKRLLSFAAFQNHMSLFGNLGPLESKLDGYKLSHKGTIQFTEDKPLSEEIIKEIIEYRRSGIEA